MAFVTTGDRTVPLPRPPEQRAAQPFPLLAMLAPVVASCALFVFTQSPFALVFAVLGPIVALATMADSRWQAVRHRRAELGRFELEVLAAREVIVLEHHRERVRLAQRAPSAGELVHGVARWHSRWQCTVHDAVPVTLGTGNVPIELISRQDARSVGGDPAREAAGTGKPREPTRVLTSLMAEAAVIVDAPIVVDARQGIAVVGPQAQAVAVLNGLVLQLANALSPEDVFVRASSHPALGWLRELPHTPEDQSTAEVSDRAARAVVEFQSRTSDTVIRLEAGEAGGADDRDCRILLRVGGGLACGIVRAPQRPEFLPLTPEFISTAQAMSGAATLAAAGTSGGTSNGALPRRVDFSQLSLTGSAASGSLACQIGIGTHGPVTIDLVADGPHAVVGGTTGSGKSELLIAWVLAMAASHPTTAVNFLLVDFKGGASFSAISALPHCVGVVTDLGHSGAKRALESLSAELRRREQLLADIGVTSIDSWEQEGAHSLQRPDANDASAAPGQCPLPRLVIVVDEFATLASRLPELQDLFADIASRGRSLGVHLILCTQRPAGVVRDAVLANCALRISLRVNNLADSVAVIGSAMAAELSRKHGGRGIVVTDDGGARTVQFAIVAAGDLARVLALWPKRPLLRPWREPLAPSIGFGELERFDGPGEEPGFAFGVVDLPAQQRQHVLHYDAASQGSLLVVGAHTAGKTGVLAALAESATRQASAVTWVPSDLEGAWDGVLEQLAHIRRGAPEPTLLLLDDVDTVIGLLGDNSAHSFVDSLVAVIREGGARGVHVVMSTTRVSAGVAPIAQVCATTLLLRATTLEDHVLSGGDRTNFDSRLPAGGGFWAGDRIQVVRAGAPAVPAPRVTQELAATRKLVVVSGAPHAILGRLSTLGPVTVLGESTPHDAVTVTTLTEVDTRIEPRIFLGDPHHWQNEWTRLITLRSSAPVAFHLCTPAQYRMFTSSPVSPPPLARPDDTVWLAMPDGTVSRALLPRAGQSSSKTPGW